MTVAVSAADGVTLVPLTRAQYEALVETGALEDSRVELLEGMLVEMAPQGIEHADVSEILPSYLDRRLPDHLRVRTALPFAATDLSEPEPDVAVVPVDRPRGEQPRWALLIVEFSCSSLAKDLGTKARVYAAAGVPAYWVLDLRRRQVHVHSEPGVDGYGQVEVVGFDRPLEVAGVTVVLADLLA